MIKRYCFQLVLCSFLLLVGCSDNPYESYLGLWERQDSKRLEVIEITQQGDAFMLNNAVLKATTAANAERNLMVLAKVEGQLSFNNGLSNNYLILADQDTLNIANQRFKRITPARVEELKANKALQDQERQKAMQQVKDQQAQERLAREAQMLERAEERANCQQLLDQINADTAAIKQYGSNNAKWTAEYEKIKQKYTEKAKQYPNCKPAFF